MGCGPGAPSKVLHYATRRLGQDASYPRCQYGPRVFLSPGDGCLCKQGLGDRGASYRHGRIVVWLDCGISGLWYMRNVPIVVGGGRE